MKRGRSVKARKTRSRVILSRVKDLKANTGSVPGFFTFGSE